MKLDVVGDDKEDQTEQQQEHTADPHTNHAPPLEAKQPEPCNETQQQKRLAEEL
jgi:hypothetical protein